LIDNSDKPMRHENYLAMASECQKLTAENLKLKEKFSRKPSITKNELTAITTGIGITTTIFTSGFITYMSAARVENTTPIDASASEVRTTPCYFVRHKLDEGIDKNLEPWDDWYIFKSMCEGCENRVVYSSPKFKTKDEAWNFAKSWHLEMCK